MARSTQPFRYKFTVYRRKEYSFNRLLSRNPINGVELHSYTDDESEEEYVINQIFNLFNFTAENGSIDKFKRNSERIKLDQSDSTKSIGHQIADNRKDKIKRITSAPNTQLKNTQHKCERITAHNHSNATHYNNSKFTSTVNLKDDKMERKVNGIEIDFIIRQRGHSPETRRLQEERLKILQPGRTRVVGKGQANERIQSYRTGQRGRKAVTHLNNQIYDRYLTIL